jgi:DtxR family Mn-dependent transcriptional regulator
MSIAKRELTRSQQDYLKALYALGSSGEGVAPSQLAARLGVSAPSVTNMLSRLAHAGLVLHDRRRGSRLTARGRKEAVRVVRRHRLLETFLVQVLGFDWSEVHEDAEILEHHISDRVLDAIDRLVGRPGEDPHGHLIPDRHGRFRQRTLTPLHALPPGRTATVREIRTDDGRRMARWKEIGLVPGARVRINSVRAMEDVFELEVQGRELVTGSEGLEGLWVEPASRGARRAR